MKEQGNLLLAIVLSLLILLGFQYFFEAPKMKKETERNKHLEQTEDLIKNNTNDLEDSITGYLEIDEALSKDERIKIAKKGQQKYFKLFNELDIAEYIVKRSTTINVIRV